MIGCDYIVQCSPGVECPSHECQRDIGQRGSLPSEVTATHIWVTEAEIQRRRQAL